MTPPAHPTPAAAAKTIDDLMEKASRALVETDYFAAEALCLKAMARARRAGDFERMARISMPLQESRRQRREAAADTGRVIVLDAAPRSGAGLEPGCYLLRPPLIGLHGRSVRDLLTRRGVPAVVLVREPTTQKGLWPIVGVGVGEPQPSVVRVQVAPPAGDVPDVGWMLAAQERLGDAAIAKVRAEWPADHRVDDLWEYLEAVPDHEKLAQAFEAACREAAKMPEPSGPRRRPLLDDPFSF